jgi:hypothetical protein
MIGSLELAAALLLGGAGTAKLVAPGPAAAMLRRAWRPVPHAVVRVGAVPELAVTLAVVARGDRASALALGGCYLAFAAVTVRLMRRRERASCGCFGRADGPVGGIHLAVNAAAIGIAAAAAIRPPGRLGGLFDEGALRGVVGAGQSALLAYLAFLALTALPSMTAARRLLMESR